MSLSTFVPPSLKRTEKEIIDRLKDYSLEVYFSINNYSTGTRNVEFTLSCKDSSKAVPSRAKEIVDRHINDWKKIYT